MGSPRTMPRPCAGIAWPPGRDTPWHRVILVSSTATGDGVPQDDAEAVRWFRMATEQGYAEAQHNLGVMYENGDGTPEDDAEAVRWFRLAAEQGHVYAQYNLGLKYATGEGVPEDDAEAVRWYRLAAEQGLAEAQLNLGLMYAHGDGTPEDFVQAYAWFSIAAASGSETSKKNKEIIAGRMTSAQIAEAQKLSREHWETYGLGRENQ